MTEEFKWFHLSFEVYLGRLMVFLLHQLIYMRSQDDATVCGGQKTHTSCQLVLSSHHVGSGDQTQVVKLGAKDLYLLNVRVKKIDTFLPQKPNLFTPH